MQLPESVGAALVSSVCTKCILFFYIASDFLFLWNKNGFQLVTQPAFMPGKMLISSSDAQVAGGWDVLNQHQIGLGGFLPKTMELDELGRFSSFVSR